MNLHAKEPSMRGDCSHFAKCEQAPQGSLSRRTRWDPLFIQMNLAFHAGRRRAFTLLELLAVLVVIAILIGVLLPMTSRMKAKSSIAGCASNMKQVSLGFLLWVNDNQKTAYPWRVEAAEGGTKNHKSGLQTNAWFQYAWISNQVLNPKVFACPADRQAQPADTYTDSAQGGFLHPNYQNQAC